MHVEWKLAVVYWITVGVYLLTLATKLKMYRNLDIIEIFISYHLIIEISDDPVLRSIYELTSFNLTLIWIIS